MLYDPGRNMKIDLEKRIGFFEVDSDFTLRPKILLNYFQEVAGVHSDRAGYDAQRLMNQGHAWVLHRIGIHIHRPPALGDALRVRTWHSGENRFRAYRDFEIMCGTEKLVSAISVWLFIDLNRKKILRIPEDIGKCYTVETSHTLDTDIDSWKSALDFYPEQVQVIATRPSDYDPLGHVNNALYFDYLETLISRFFPDAGKIRRIIIQFNKEVPTNVAEVEVGIRQEADRYVFKIFSNECVYAVGEFKLFSKQKIYIEEGKYSKR